MKQFLITSSIILLTFASAVIWMKFNKPTGGDPAGRGMAAGFAFFYAAAITVGLLLASGIFFAVRAYWVHANKNGLVALGIVIALGAGYALYQSFKPSQNDIELKYAQTDFAAALASSDVAKQAQAVSQIMVYDIELAKAALKKTDEQMILRHFLLNPDDSAITQFIVSGVLENLVKRYPEELTNLTFYQSYRLKRDVELQKGTAPYTYSDEFNFIVVAEAFDTDDEKTKTDLLANAKSLEKPLSSHSSILFLSLLGSLANIYSEYEIHPDHMKNYKDRTRFLKANGYKFSSEELADEDLKQRLSTVDLTDLL